MKVLKQTLDDAVVLNLDGEFDSFVTNAFTNEVQKVLDGGIHNVVLNMKAVKFVNSTALGSMIKARKACKKAQGELFVAEPSSAVRDAMGSLGLDRLFVIHDSNDEALAALRSGPGIEMQGSEESTVMISVPGESGTVVGRVRRLDVDAMDCRVDRLGDKVVPGREVRLKFRLPLYRKEFFELKARIEGIEPSGSSKLVSLHFTDIDDADRADIQSFVKDMGELRRAADDS